MGAACHSEGHLADQHFGSQENGKRGAGSSVERASLARPWQAREHRDAHLVAVSTLCRNVCLFTRKSAARRCVCPAVSLAYHGLASEARSTACGTRCWAAKCPSEWQAAPIDPI